MNLDGNDESTPIPRQLPGAMVSAQTSCRTIPPPKVLPAPPTMTRRAGPDTRTSPNPFPKPAPKPRCGTTWIIPRRKSPPPTSWGTAYLCRDPQLALTSIGAATEGYTAISVRTGESLSGVSAEDQILTPQPPEWMSWPLSAGFFRTAIDQRRPSSTDPQERWSFSVRNGDGPASARVVDPDGNQIPVTVIRPNGTRGDYTAQDCQLFDLRHCPLIRGSADGQDNKVYRVRGRRKGNGCTSYEYQVVLPNSRLCWIAAHEKRN